MKYTPFHEQQFRQSVSTALKTVKNILDTERHPVLAADEPHEYSDKYALAEFLTNTAIASMINALTATGLQPDQQKTVLSWVHGDGKTTNKQAVTLRFLAEDMCSFLKEDTVDVVTGEHEVESITTKNTTGFFGKAEKEEVTTRVVQRVKEFHWKVGIRYKLILFPGTALDQAIVLQQRSTETVLVTQVGGHGTVPLQGSSKVKPPFPERTVHVPVDTSLTWLFQNISPDQQTCEFAIGRDSAECKTPRRNEDVVAAVDFFRHLHDWSRITQGFFLQRVEKEILAKDNPVHPRPQQQPPAAQPQKKSSSILEPGDIGTMQGLMKEPTFNGKKVRIVEYNREQQRYKAEPVDPASGLPPTLSIKPANIKPDHPVVTNSPVMGPPLHSVTDEGIFCPILPLMENGSVLTASDVGDFLQEQTRSMDEALDSLARVYPAKQLVKLVSVTEASLVLLGKHMEHLAVQYHDSINYVEDLLKQQLIAAIGKEVGQTDFEQFMRFHNRKLFGSGFAPSPFSHAIRRPGHYPDGILSIEAKTPATSTSSSTSISTSLRSNASGGSSSNTIWEPIETWVRSIAGSSSPSIYIPIDAAASVEITGDRFLHGWMQHRFKSKHNPEHRLACRARQFSSFLVILGTVSGPDTFDPKDAIILQNKDEVLIPLMTEVLPSAKEFKDAIKSLSPDQQEFAKAFRGMQLESSVFGVCVVQIKPQLEKLLGLPDGALTKEIQLTQDLLSLFVDYQVPSDLMTFDGAPESTQAERVDAVRGYVKSVMDVIDESKKNQLKEEAMKADMRAEMTYKPPVQPLVVPEAADSSVALADSSEASNRSGAAGRLRRRLVAKKHAGEPEMMAMAMAMPTEGCMAAPDERMYGATTAPSPQKKMSKPATRSISRSEIKQIAESTVDSFQPQSHKVLSFGDLSSGTGEDFSLLPKVLDAKLEKYDKDNALRSTIIKAGSGWTRTRQENFLTGPISMSLGSGDIATEKKKAFDLLDAISRSGTLAIDCAELHVVIAISHCFDNDVMGTVVQDNINPIAKVERSSLMLASTIYGQPVDRLIENEQDLQRLKSSFPLLFEPSSVQSGAIELG